MSLHVCFVQTWEMCRVLGRAGDAILLRGWGTALELLAIGLLDPCTQAPSMLTCVDARLHAVLFAGCLALRKCACDALGVLC